MMLVFQCENRITHCLQKILLLYQYAQWMNKLWKAKIVQIVELHSQLRTKIRSFMIRFPRHSDEKNFLFLLPRFVPIVVKKGDYVFVMKENYIVEIVMQVESKLFPFILPTNHIRSMITKYGEVISGIL
jgi:hypothetical protein